jgi:hypothetical protein
MSRLLFYVPATILLAASIVHGQATFVETDWIRQFGGVGPVSVIAQATDTNGNVYVGGLTGGTLASADENELENAGGLDVFVRKYDVDGNEIWTRQFGGLLDD